MIRVRRGATTLTLLESVYGAKNLFTVTCAYVCGVLVLWGTCQQHIGKF